MGPAQLIEFMRKTLDTGTETNPPEEVLAQVKGIWEMLDRQLSFGHAYPPQWTPAMKSYDQIDADIDYWRGR